MVEAPDFERRGTRPVPRKTALIWVCAVVLVAAIISGVMGCSRRDDHNGRTQGDKFTAVALPWPGSNPLYVGMEKGYFKEEGLDFRLQPVATGKMGLEAVLSGKADCTGAADTPIARAVIDGKRISVIATIAYIQRAIIIIAKKESGISKPGDLKGKTIGVTFGAGAQFFLHIYLVANHINPYDVRIVNITPDNTVDALLDNQVQAVSTWSPHKLVLLEKLGTNAVILDDPALYLQSFNMVATQQYAKNNPVRIRKFLRALLRADTFIQENPDEARAIMSKYIGTANTLYQKEWSDYIFTTVLDQSLVLNLEDQARWMIQQAKGTTQNTPNFMDYIDVGPLKAVQSNAVRIIGK